MGDKDFVVTPLLLVEFHYGTKGHKFESLPRWGEAVVGISLMMAVYHRVAFEIRGVNLFARSRGRMSD